MAAVPAKTINPHAHQRDGKAQVKASGTKPLRQQGGSPPAKRWNNPLPGWIPSDEGYSRLRASVKATLQFIADRCNKPDERGSLTGAFGGVDLKSCVGGRRTFWRHLRTLERLGYVVCIGRGGLFGGRNFANQYGIPSNRWALDHRRAQREMRRMVLEPDGKFRPQVVRPGDQATIWREARASEVTLPPQSDTRGRVKLTLPPCQNDTPPSPVPSPLKNTMVMGGVSGVFEKQGGKKTAAKCPHVDDDDFCSIERLIELWAECCRRGLAASSEDGRIKFVALAEYAMRIGREPARFFAALINAGRWLFISNEDESIAVSRLRFHDTGQAPRRDDWREEYRD